MGFSIRLRTTSGAFFVGVLLAACSAGGDGVSGSALPIAGDAARFSVTNASRLQRANPAYETIYSFHGADGSNPRAALTLGANGMLYGTTQYGGSSNGGVVYELTAGGKERVLYSFKGGGYDAAGPTAAVTMLAGKLYGTTSYGGGQDGEGTIFEVSTSGVERVIHVFGGAGDGVVPTGNLIAMPGTGGVLFGTTQYGGPNGAGVLFEVNAAGGERVLFGFGGFLPNGSFPTGVTGVGGVFYGTTQSGGNDNEGSVFEVTALGAGRTIYSFAGGADGENPVGPVTAVDGNLYGLTQYGGANGLGTVFKVSPSGTEQTIYSFKGGKDGEYPHASLVDVNGKLYGTTAYGGARGVGTVFMVSTSGAERVIHSFRGGTDGEYPAAALLYVNGALCGTTTSGGTGGNGTVYEVSP